MLKAFIVVALVLCINTSEVVEQDLSKDIRPLWTTIQCIINSEKVQTTAKDVLGLIKQREWFDIIEYVLKKYPTLKGEVRRCINGGDAQLGYNIDYIRCITYYPPPYCVKFLPPEFIDPNFVYP